MNFGARIFNEDAWKGSGTVTGTHTYKKPIRIGTIQQVGDGLNTVELKDDEVVVAKNLRVEGELITAGWPPPGGDMQLPDHANFKSMNILGGNLSVLPGGGLFVQGNTNLNNVDAIQVAADTMIGYNTQATFLDVDVIRARTVGSRVNFPDAVNVEGNITAAKYLGNDVIVQGLIDGDVVVAHDLMRSHGTMEGNVLVATQSFTAPTATINGTFTTNGHATLDSLTVNNNTHLADVALNKITSDFETEKDVHIKGNLVVDGIFPLPPITIPNHLHTQHITLNKDFTFGHQKTDITYKKISLEDTNPSFFGTGGQGEITLDATDGSIKCNGSVTVHNQYTSTANPAGVICDYVNTLNVALDTLTGHRSDFGRNVAGESIYCNGQIEAEHLKVNSMHADGAMTGTWNFSGATVNGLPHSGGGGGNGYASIVEYDDHVDITKRLTTSHIGWTNGNPVNFQGKLEFAGAEVDFTNATLTGLPDTGYASITETDNSVVISKPTTYTFTQDGTSVPHFNIRNDYIESIVPVRALKFGYDDAGLEFTTGNEKRIDWMLDDGLAFSIRKVQQSGSEVAQTIDYSNNTLLNDLYVNAIHARPPNLKVTMANAVEFEQTTEFKAHVELANATLSGFTIAPGNEIQFQPTPSNPIGAGTQINDISIETQFLGSGQAIIAFQGYSPQVILNRISGKNILAISDLLISCNRPLHTVSNSSSGNFTHCHLTEGDQSITWEPGMCVTSTGEYCSRDQNGALIPLPKDAPSGSHGVCKVAPSTKGEHALGIVASVETVAGNQIEHAHGGVTIKAPVMENDGHKMVRVAASGDVLAWVVQPTFDEIDVPPMSGVWNKCVGDGYGGHTILSSHVGVEAEGHLAVDNQIIDTSTATVAVTAGDITVIPAAPTMTPSLFGGIYTKTINGITQNQNVIMVCNEDFSFLLTEHLDGLENRVAAVEATLAELLGPD